MNYRHAFHAGGFADVVKHAVLARILVYLCTKPAAFCVVDSHAGAGLYDLAGPEASRSLEWRDGIARLQSAELGAAARGLLAPYLDFVGALNRGGECKIYPGSPALARSFLRAQDRLLACELEPNAAAALVRNFAGDRRIKPVAIDGWTALKAYVPPKERRGVVLVDPPFEEDDDFARLAGGLDVAHRKWAGGIYVLWYPIKTRAGPDMLARRLKRSGIPKILRAEITTKPAREDGPLTGCGLIVVNPPWTLENELATLLPELAAALSAGGQGDYRIDRLSNEKQFRHFSTGRD